MHKMDGRIIAEHDKEQELHRIRLRQEVKKRSDKLMNYFLASFFAGGLILAFYYDTWLVAVGVGGLSLLAYYSAKAAFPNSNMYQYVLSGVFGIFKAQYIYQMHGLFEMHFIVFIASALLITYQNWKVQIPLVLVVAIHHAVFAFLQNTGYTQVYFTKLDYFELSTFAIHFVLAGIISFICGLWAYQLEKYSNIQIQRTLEMAKLQKEAVLSIERKLNEEALEQSNKELRKSNSELDKFVYSVSHDLRAPLTSMLGIIDLSEDATEEQFMVKNLGMLKESIIKLDCFIADILNYSRNARLEVMNEEINFKEMLNEIMNNLTNINGHNSKVEVNVNIRNEAPFVSDKQRVSIVLNNLISNAIRYQNPRAHKPFVYIKVHSHEAGSSIVIRDNGIGLKKEMHEKIFEMFYRASHHSEGSGLGLYIVKETIEKLNGRIKVESELEVGTEFNIHIPNYYQKEALA
ncbi:MAG: arcB 3 [Segetibacter sp.]|nr:arcB 3 [Segetibacter sp.]